MDFKKVIEEAIADRTTILWKEISAHALKVYPNLKNYMPLRNELQSFKDQGILVRTNDLSKEEYIIKGTI